MSVELFVEGHVDLVDNNHQPAEVEEGGSQLLPGFCMGYEFIRFLFQKHKLMQLTSI